MHRRLSQRLSRRRSAPAEARAEQSSAPRPEGLEFVSIGGMLLKRSRERRRRSLGAALRAPTWKPRYFELAQDVLRWHDDMEAMRRGAAARGMIRLYGVRLVTKIDEA